MIKDFFIIVLSIPMRPYHPRGGGSRTREPGEAVQVRVDGTVTAEYPLSASLRTRIEGVGGYNELVIGWGKGSEGMIKNHYPKGLRRAHYLP